MNDLIRILSFWPGRRPMQEHMQFKGYWLPQRFSEMVLEYVCDCDEPSLQFYWDEVARECLCNPPTMSDNRKYNPGAFPNYRSAYLDELAASPENVAAEGAILSLHPGYRKFQELMYSVPGMILQVADRIKEEKESEISTLKIDSSGWKGSKSDSTEFLGKIAESRGFAIKRKKWRRRFCDQIEIALGVDDRSRFGWSSSLPLICEISHLSAGETRRFDSYPHCLLPGFVYYRNFETPDYAVLGIQAFVDLFVTVGELLDSSATSK